MSPAQVAGSAESGPDGEATAVLTLDKTSGEDGRTAQLLAPDRGAREPEATQLMQPPDTDRTQLLHIAEREAPPAEPDSDYAESTVHGSRGRRLKRRLLPAVLAFVLAVGGITVCELLWGNSVSGGRGTSLGQVVGPDSDSSGPSGEKPGTERTPEPERSDDGPVSGDPGPGPSPGPQTGTAEDAGPGDAPATAPTAEASDGPATPESSTPDEETEDGSAAEETGSGAPSPDPGESGTGTQPAPDAG